MLSDQGWARLFDRDPDALGRTVAFNQQFARLLGAGAAAGLVMAFSIMSLLRSMVVLQNVSFLDAASFAASLALVVVAGTIAAFFPAHPASRVDPALTLRSGG